MRSISESTRFARVPIIVALVVVLPGCIRFGEQSVVTHGYSVSAGELAGAWLVAGDLQDGPGRTIAGVVIGDSPSSETSETPDLPSASMWWLVAEGEQTTENDAVDQRPDWMTPARRGELTVWPGVMDALFANAADLAVIGVMEVDGRRMLTPVSDETQHQLTVSMGSLETTRIVRAGDWFIAEHRGFFANRYFAFGLSGDNDRLEVVNLPHPAQAVRTREGSMTDHDRRLAYREELWRSLFETIADGSAAVTFERVASAEMPSE